MDEEVQELQENGSIQVGLDRRCCPECGREVEPGVATCPHDGGVLFHPPENDRAFKNKYRFLGAIGSGGMGVIYKAHQTVMNKDVAVKMLHPHIVSSEAFRRFQIEATAASRLHHPFIIAVHDMDTTESGLPYIVMDYVEGRTLASIIEKDGPLSVPRALRLFDQVCGALAHAHKRGVLHRDLKPSNIMIVRIDGQEEVRIMDFGIAKLIDEKAANRLTRTGEAIGSPLYMSPEQVRGNSHIDQRSDLYSLGCVMYESLTGAPPFSGATPMETMMMHLSEQPVTLGQSLLGKKEFNPDLEAMVQRLLEKDPDRRYQSMEELQSSVGRLLTGRSLERFVDSEPARKFDRPRLIVMVTAAALAAVVLGAIGFYFGSKNQTSSIETANSFNKLTEIREDKPQTDSEMYRQIIYERVRQRRPIVDLSVITKTLPIANDDLAPLEDASFAQDINITGAHIDDRGLEHLRALKLSKLNLNRTDVKDLHALENMSNLANLLVAETALNSKGMRVISNLRNLQVLNVGGTGISDADLDRLLSLPKLRRLTIVGCSHLTPRAVEDLQKKLPKCLFIPTVSKFRQLQARQNSAILETPGQSKDP